MADPLIYPPRVHFIFARAFAERAQEKTVDAQLGDEAAAKDAKRLAARAVYELALACESLAYAKARENFVPNNSDLS